jgi:Ni/Co efflux regulator RcnB
MKHKLLAILAVGLLAGPMAAPAVTAATVDSEQALVPRTGQTDSYDESGLNRDDGGLQKGVIWPVPRFKDTGQGTIKDQLTGLIWLKNANCGGAMNWQDALNFVAGINDGSNDCGDTSKRGTHRTDWRLPNVRELQSLVDYGTYNPALPGNVGNPFTDFQAYNFYWSSTSYAGDPTSYAWVVLFFFEGGDVGWDFKGSNDYVIAVRGGL